MKSLPVKQSRYTSLPAKVALPSKLFPSAIFYFKFIGVVLKAGYRAKRGVYTDELWGLDSLRIVQLLEKAGLQFEFSGLENLEKLDRPCVFIGNHMSIMETLILPIVILPYMKVTFVVKESLLNYPVFKYVMRSRNPVAVTRTNPRQDLKTVMSEGPERLANNISIIVFPQTTRSTEFDPEHFGSIGTKLAKKAGAPIIPFALKTDAWRNGKTLKDFGKLAPEIPVKVAFGEPMEITGKGNEQHQQVVDFITDKLGTWKL
jgi:1-acyl-sn-glycerol-3-phosphate acyltransferase